MLLIYFILICYILPVTLTWLTFRYRIKKGYDKPESIIIFCTLFPFLNIIMLVVASILTISSMIPKLSDEQLTNKFFNIK